MDPPTHLGFKKDNLISILAKNIVSASGVEQKNILLGFSQLLRIVSRHFWGSKNKLKQPLACYIVGKIFMYRISFNIVYNESAHKNMNISEYLFFHRVQEKNINILKTEMEGHEAAQCCHTHIYIYQIGPFKLLVRTQHNGELYLLGDNTSITARKYLYYYPSQPILVVRCPIL